jgi:hypothetical protein
MRVGALDDLERPRAGGGDAPRRLRPLIAGVGEDALDEREAPTRPAEQPADAVAVLDVGGVDLDAQQQSERVDEDVPLAASDLLAGIVALPIVRPPFCAALALWLSRIAALGLAARPSRSRTAR